MRLIVSTNAYSHHKYKTTKTLKNIDWSAVECLIFHSSIDNEVDILLELSKAGEIVKKIIYINQTINSLFYGLFAGMSADIYNDATMLEEESILDFLVDNYRNTGMTIKSPDADVDTISKFLATVSKENAETLKRLVSNASWLKTLETSVNNVGTALVRTNEANSNMVEMFHKTAEMIADLEQSHVKTTEEIEKLSKYIEETERRNAGGKQNTAFFFSTYQVANTVPKVLYIKVYSPCRFLNSFIAAYQHYLKMDRQISSKILLAVPKLKNFMTKYDSLPRLAPETVNTLNLAYLGDAFVTFEPKTAVLNAFFSMKTELFIVIDMMFGDNLLAGPKVIPVGAVNGLSDMQKFNIPANKCIISFTGMQANIIIPYLKDYIKASESARRTFYSEKCKDEAYKKLNILLWGR